MSDVDYRRGRTRTVDYETSEEAADKISQSAGTIRAWVKHVLANHPEGLTDDELRPLVVAHMTRRPAESSIRKRRGELYEDGEVEIVTDRMGNTVTRPNSDGNRMIVWRLTPPTPDDALF